jgi:hypothetical protein
MVHQQGNRTGCRRLSRVLVAVGSLSPDTREDGPGRDPAAVVFGISDDGIGIDRHCSVGHDRAHRKSPLGQARGQTAQVDVHVYAPASFGGAT